MLFNFVIYIVLSDIKLTVILRLSSTIIYVGETLKFRNLSSVVYFETIIKSNALTSPTFFVINYILYF